MGLELQLLAWAAALTVVQALIHTVGGVLQVGMSPLVGNREGVSDFPAGPVGPGGPIATCWKTWCPSPRWFWSATRPVRLMR